MVIVFMIVLSRVWKLGVCISMGSEGLVKLFLKSLDVCL